jgi:hypothetical protein
MSFIREVVAKPLEANERGDGETLRSAVWTLRRSCHGLYGAQKLAMFVRIPRYFSLLDPRWRTLLPAQKN